MDPEIKVSDTKLNSFDLNNTILDPKITTSDFKINRFDPNIQSLLSKLTNSDAELKIFDPTWATIQILDPMILDLFGLPSCI
eukprot:7128904-Karenia_brevis.AAC.1